MLVAWCPLGYLEGKQSQFEGKNRRPCEVIDSIIREVGRWIFVSKDFKDLSFSMYLRDWISSISFNPLVVKKAVRQWMPPQKGVLKLNFDGSSKGNPGLGGLGCVIRDSNSSIVQIICGPLGSCD